MSLGSSLHQLHLFLPRGAFSLFARAIDHRHLDQSRNNEVCYSDIFPIACLPELVLYVFFNPKFKEDWKLLKRHVTKKSGSASVSISSQAGCVEQDFYYDCGMYSHLQGKLTVCDCCEAFLLDKASVLQTLNKITQLSCLDSGFLPKARRLLVRLCHAVRPLWLCRWRRFLCLRQFLTRFRLAEEPASIRVEDSLCALCLQSPKS